jgi:hypothetical protein
VVRFLVELLDVWASLLKGSWGLRLIFLRLCSGLTVFELDRPLLCWGSFLTACFVIVNCSFNYVDSSWSSYVQSRFLLIVRVGLRLRSTCYCTSGYAGNSSPVSLLSGTLRVCGLLALPYINQSLGDSIAAVRTSSVNNGWCCLLLEDLCFNLCLDCFITIGVVVVLQSSGEASVGAIESVIAKRYRRYLLSIGWGCFCSSFLVSFAPSGEFAVDLDSLA